MLWYSLSDAADLKRLSSLLQWLAIGLVFLGGALQLLRFVVDQREKAISAELSRQKDNAQLEREATLRGDLQKSQAQLQQLASRDIYRPLTAEVRQNMVSYLRTLRLRPDAAGLKVVISIETGSRNRVFVRDEILSILKEAGVPAEDGRAGITFGSGALPKLNFRIAKTDEQLVNALLQGLSLMIKETDFPGHKVDGLAAGTIEMDLNGEPVFNSDGTLTLK